MGNGMLTAKHKTGMVFFPAFDWAIDPTHPEREERLLYTQDQVLEEGVLDINGIVEFKPDLVTLRDVQRVHFCIPDVWSVTTESHLISAGGAKTIGMAVLDKQVEKGFALVRPPGHHAMRVIHGARGFCNINIEAIMIEFLRRAYGIERVAIVDTDCHHGDGTQDIYWHDPDTLFISMHQDGRTLYPGTGFIEERGGPNAIGATVNIPLPPHTGEEGFLSVVQHIVLPILDDFKPELIVNSAGQDNHFSDPITSMNFSAQGYAKLTSLLKADIAVLEGGYSIEGALPYMNVGIILAMAGVDYSHVREPDYDPEKLRQGALIDNAIREIEQRVMSDWRQREEMKERIQKSKDYIRRRRTIFYDTDGITEEQIETVRVCADCGGALRIESVSDRGESALAAHIPRKACPSCIEQAHRWFEEKEAAAFGRVFLQDRPRDVYIEKKGRLTPGS